MISRIEAQYETPLFVTFSSVYQGRECYPDYRCHGNIKQSPRTSVIMICLFFRHSRIMEAMYWISDPKDKKSHKIVNGVLNHKNHNKSQMCQYLSSLLMISFAVYRWLCLDG